MWNSQAPLELLKEMPAQLNRANLERIQQMIDVDKYRNSFELHKDLCGEYAPFCNVCDKDVVCPCAVAYVKMLQAEGLNIEIAIADTEEKPAVKGVRIAIAKRKTTK